MIEEVTIGQDIVETKEDQISLDQVRDKISVFNFEIVKIPI